MRTTPLTSISGALCIAFMSSCGSAKLNVRVIDAKVGQPVSNVSIRLKAVKYHGFLKADLADTVVTNRTDADGLFSVTGVPTRHQESNFIFEKPGYHSAAVVLLPKAAAAAVISPLADFSDSEFPLLLTKNKAEQQDLRQIVIVPLYPRDSH